jgi:hypothetical protein
MLMMQTVIEAEDRKEMKGRDKIGKGQAGS